MSIPVRLIVVAKDNEVTNEPLIQNPITGINGKNNAVCLSVYVSNASPRRRAHSVIPTLAKESVITT